MPNGNLYQNENNLLKLIELGRITITKAQGSNKRKLNIRLNQTGWVSS
jgi:hypothetical protein